MSEETRARTIDEYDTLYETVDADDKWTFGCAVKSIKRNTWARYWVGDFVPDEVRRSLGRYAQAVDICERIMSKPG